MKEIFYDNGRNMCWDMQFWIISLDEERDSFKNPCAGNMTSVHTGLNEKIFSCLKDIPTFTLVHFTYLSNKMYLLANHYIWCHCLCIDKLTCMTFWGQVQKLSCVFCVFACTQTGENIENTTQLLSYLKCNSTWATVKREILERLNYNSRFPSCLVRVDEGAAEVNREWLIWLFWYKSTTLNLL